MPLFFNIAKVITDSNLFGFGSVVRLNDLDRFNSEVGLNIEPYARAAHTCFWLVAREYPDGTPTELIFDRIEKIDDKLARARAYAAADNIIASAMDDRRGAASCKPDVQDCAWPPGCGLLDLGVP